MKSYFSRCARIEPDSNDIMTDIAKTRCALETAYAGFDNATDPDLIDCYIYEVNAVQKRYKYLLQEAARMNLAPQLPTEELLCEKPSVPLLHHTLREFPFSVS